MVHILIFDHYARRNRSALDFMAVFGFCTPAADTQILAGANAFMRIMAYVWI